MGSRVGPDPGQCSTRLLVLKPPPWAHLDPAEAPGKQPQTLAFLSPRWMPRSPRTLWDPGSPRSDHGPQAIHPPLDLPCRGQQGQAWSRRTRCDFFHETSQVNNNIASPPITLTGKQTTGPRLGSRDHTGLLRSLEGEGAAHQLLSTQTPSTGTREQPSSSWRNRRLVGPCYLPAPKRCH